MPLRSEQSRYSWDAGSQRYRDRRTGRYVSRATIRDVLDRRLDREARHVDALAGQLQRGEISAREWHTAMRTSVRNVQLTSATLARGGWAQMRASDYGHVGQRTRQQLEYLQRFAEQIEAGLPLDGRFRLRAKMYASGGRSVYHEVERDGMRSIGMDQERSVRHARDSCNGCVSEAARGWVPIGTLIPVGQRDCKSNCRCAVSFRRSSDVREAAA